MKILIADDSQQIREVIKSVLSVGKYDFIECSDGSDSVELYFRHHPDIVLMDINMKKKNGLTASHEILDKDPNAKIIIVTQYNDEKLKTAAKELGITGYITKDFIYELDEYINKHVLHD
ncbi:MAG: response regulator [Ignavibacteria bacterium]|jgi:CheY-like chemotaxis protein